MTQANTLRGFWNYLHKNKSVERNYYDNVNKLFKSQTLNPYEAYQALKKEAEKLQTPLHQAEQKQENLLFLFIQATNSMLQKPNFDPSEYENLVETFINDLDNSHISIKNPLKALEITEHQNNEHGRYFDIVIKRGKDVKIVLSSAQWDEQWSGENESAKHNEKYIAFLSNFRQFISNTECKPLTKKYFISGYMEIINAIFQVDSFKHQELASHKESTNTNKQEGPKKKNDASLTGKKAYWDNMEEGMKRQAQDLYKSLGISDEQKIKTFFQKMDELFRMGEKRQSGITHLEMMNMLQTISYWVLRECCGLGDIALFTKSWNAFKSEKASGETPQKTDTNDVKIEPTNNNEDDISAEEELKERVAKVLEEAGTLSKQKTMHLNLRLETLLQIMEDTFPLTENIQGSRSKRLLHKELGEKFGKSLDHLMIEIVYAHHLCFDSEDLAKLFDEFIKARSDDAQGQTSINSAEKITINNKPSDLQGMSSAISDKESRQKIRIFLDKNKNLTKDFTDQTKLTAALKSDIEVMNILKENTYTYPVAISNLGYTCPLNTFLLKCFNGLSQLYPGQTSFRQVYNLDMTKLNETQKTFITQLDNILAFMYQKQTIPENMLKDFYEHADENSIIILLNARYSSIFDISELTLYLHKVLKTAAKNHDGMVKRNFEADACMDGFDIDLSKIKIIDAPYQFNNFDHITDIHKNVQDNFNVGTNYTMDAIQSQETTSIGGVKKNANIGDYIPYHIAFRRQNVAQIDCSEGKQTSSLKLLKNLEISNQAYQFKENQLAPEFTLKTKPTRGNFFTCLESAHYQSLTRLFDNVFLVNSDGLVYIIDLDDENTKEDFYAVDMHFNAQIENKSIFQESHLKLSAESKRDILFKRFKKTCKEQLLSWDYDEELAEKNKNSGVKSHRADSAYCMAGHILSYYESFITPSDELKSQMDEMREIYQNINKQHGCLDDMRTIYTEILNDTKKMMRN